MLSQSAAGEILSRAARDLLPAPGRALIFAEGGPALNDSGPVRVPQRRGTLGAAGLLVAIAETVWGPVIVAFDGPLP